MNLSVQHVILKEVINDKTKELVLYLNASTPSDYEYYVNVYNTKTGSGGGCGYIELDLAIKAYNKYK